MLQMLCRKNDQDNVPTTEVDVAFGARRDAGSFLSCNGAYRQQPITVLHLALNQTR